MMQLRGASWDLHEMRQNAAVLQPYSFAHLEERLLSTSNYLAPQR